MTEEEAARLLAAADDDPVLAAWSSVIWDLDVHNIGEVSSWDAWDAFERLYSFDLITEVQYDCTSQQRFISGRPTWDQYQRVYHRMKQPLFERTKEPPMSKKPSLGNPFASSSSLVTKDRDTALSAGREAAALPSRHASPGLQPFSSSREISSPSPMMLDPVPRGTSRVGLPCNDPHGTAVQVGPHELRFELRCLNDGCGAEPLRMMESGGDRVGPDQLPGGSVSVVQVILHAKCPNCGAAYHVSAGRTVTEDNFR
jgi:hypothetical protein